MKKFLLVCILVCNLFASGKSLPFGFISSLDKTIILKNDMVIITLNKSPGEVIVPKSMVRIMKNDYPTKQGNYSLIISDHYLFEERKTLDITEEQYNYLKNTLYGF